MDKRIESLGPAERIIQLLLSCGEHMVHNRPGMVVADAQSAIGVRWIPVTHKVEGDSKAIYRLAKVGRRKTQTRVGTLQPDGSIRDGRRKVAEYRPAGLFPEVACWMYDQALSIYQLDNEFCARWASFALQQDHRDLKVVLAALMLVQARKGEPVHDDDGTVAFHDDDYRDVGEAMLLLYDKKLSGLNPKLILRVHQLLSLPGVAQLNRQAGFGRSARKPFFGRWHKVVERWLRFREDNPKLLLGLVKAGFSRTVRELARRVGYKPTSAYFFEVLRWKQKQAQDGRRTMAIGQAVEQAESWEALSEQEICERIVATRPGYKRIVGLVPQSLGLTPAIMAAAIEARSLSDKDLVILTPTLEELGLLQVGSIRQRWERALAKANDMRAANIATRVKSEQTQSKLEAAADNAVQQAVAEVARDIRVYFIVDISSSMQGAIEQAKSHIEKFLHSFPVDRIHVSVFNTVGREVRVKHASRAGVRQAFNGIRAGGGTDYGAGVLALKQYAPKPGEDVLFIFVGDEEAGGFVNAVRRSGLEPVAFGLVRMRNSPMTAVQDTAAKLGIPCFIIDERTFEDVYAIGRTVRALVASTPVGQARSGKTRVALVEQILKTELLAKPLWAA